MHYSITFEASTNRLAASPMPSAAKLEVLERCESQGYNFAAFF